MDNTENMIIEHSMLISIGAILWGLIFLIRGIRRSNRWKWQTGVMWFSFMMIVLGVISLIDGITSEGFAVFIWLGVFIVFFVVVEDY